MLSKAGENLRGVVSWIKVELIGKEEAWGNTYLSRRAGGQPGKFAFD